MTYSDYSLSPEEYQMYLVVKKSSKLDEIWHDLINRITEENLKQEALTKGYTLLENPDLEEDVIAVYMMFDVPDASKELSEYLKDNLYPFVVCLKV